jgi:hypothetical protein
VNENAQRDSFVPNFVEATGLCNFSKDKHLGACGCRADALTLSTGSHEKSEALDFGCDPTPANGQSVNRERRRKAPDGIDPVVARLRINLLYLFRHGSLPNLLVPTYFTEMVQCRKLHGHRYPTVARNMAKFADKLIVKDFVAGRLSLAWIIPTLWHGNELPVKRLWSGAVVIKARHGCNQTIFLWPESQFSHRTRAEAHSWLTHSYGYWLDETVYAHIPRGLLVEPFVGSGQCPPIDYKFYVFAGRAEYIQVHLDRGGHHRWIIFDRDWRRVSTPSRDPDPVRPGSFDRMIEAAEELGCAFDFVRVDLYEVEGRPLFGEMSFYPGSGLDPFHPATLDQEMGKKWLRAVGPFGLAVDAMSI